MADETKKRTTSFAKTVKGLEQGQSLLDNLSPEVREVFNRVADAALAKIREHKEQEKISETGEKLPTHAPRPELHLRPEGPTRRAVDRKIDYEKIRKIAAAVRQRREAARGLSRDFEKER